MKCVCGYEYKSDESRGFTNVIIGDDPFKEYEVHVLHRYWLSDGLTSTDIDLFVCPKCKTVRCGE